MNAKKAMEAVEFICKHMGEQVYIVDTVVCDECPDMGKGACVFSRPGKHSIKAVGDCRMRRVIVRRVSMNHVILSLDEENVSAIIGNYYPCAPGEIFTTYEAATEHMESLPDDILKYHQPGPDGRRAKYTTTGGEEHEQSG